MCKNKVHGCKLSALIVLLIWVVASAIAKETVVVLGSVGMLPVPDADEHEVRNFSKTPLPRSEAHD